MGILLIFFEIQVCEIFEEFFGMFIVLFGCGDFIFKCAEMNMLTVEANMGYPFVATTVDAFVF